MGKGEGGRRGCLGRGVGVVMGFGGMIVTDFKATGQVEGHEKETFCHFPLFRDGGHYPWPGLKFNRCALWRSVKSEDGVKQGTS